jgi:hypothetical protein
MDALVCSVNGRYLKAKITDETGEERELRYGVLPDRSPYSNPSI